MSALNPIAISSLADEALGKIVQAITTGEFRPGERLSEAHLARQLGISRGPLREALGPAESLDVPDGTTLGALRDRLITRSGAHARVLARGRAVRCALNQTMSDEGAVVSAEAEVAFFPPVTGG